MMRRLALLLVVAVIGAAIGRGMKDRIISVIGVFVLVLAACSGGGSSGDGVRSTTSSLTTSATFREPATTTTEPPATDGEVLQPVLESLIDRHDEAVAAILTDPRVAGNRGDPVVKTYLDLFVADSEFPSVALEHWAGEGAAGRFYRPGPLGRMYDSTVVSVDVVSDDEVTFEVCTLRSIVIVNGEGAEIGAEGGATGGSITAARVGGRWLLRDLTRIEAPASCPTPQEET